MADRARHWHLVLFRGFSRLTRCRWGLRDSLSLLGDGMLNGSHLLLLRVLTFSWVVLMLRRVDPTAWTWLSVEVLLRVPHVVLLMMVLVKM